MTAQHAYTADKNKMYILPSGNWFTGFVANTEARTVSFNYCDRRRSGQVARRYIVRFEDDCSTVRDIIAISAQGGRVEMFKSTVARDVCANILRRAMMVAFEEDFAKEVEQNEQNEQAVKEDHVEPAKTVNVIVNKMGVVTSAFALIAFIMTFIYFFFGEASTTEAVMKALVGAELGALVALFAVDIAMYAKNRK